MSYTTLAAAKKHMNIEEAFTDDDNYINDLISVCELSISNYCDGGLDDYDDNDMPVTVKQATLLLIGHLYVTRTIVSFSQGVEIPYSFKFLLNPYRVHNIS